MKNSRKHKKYPVWSSMKDRCHNPNNKAFHNYGGKGIKVCQRWKDSFVAFMEDMGECPEGQTLERKDSRKDYCPDNCHWASRTEQNRNTNRNIANEKIVAIIRGLNRDQGYGNRRLSRFMGCSRSGVRYLINGGRWAEVEPKENATLEELRIALEEFRANR